ncbi:hypothetical protein FW587_00400 [Campylobacter jejuni]|uniref:hypothetical protein n=1 Tax=Campylobacter jejuni TaxID=197 RepID=UPI0003001FCF|nr:hypothetical protein [Campylobacter jejuni]ECK7595582.1 hypothetical protein [Campylobacter jejuni]ECL3287973.1 hypothetical protein [Campylobacter jejuni]ECP7610069.1 hypothetical protein [Campylobacter jejuni]ECP8662044.1 hypothetical protein [Campylobacter jejuni]ECQ7389221.1 hypothetical protein [Campylobacter jejuni]
MLQSRLLMNLRGIGISFIPRYFFQINLDKIFNDILKYNIKDLEEIQTRVKYYNQINEFFTPTAKEKIENFLLKAPLMLLMLMKSVNTSKMNFYGIKNLAM